MIWQARSKLPTGQHLLGVLDYGGAGSIDAQGDGPPVASIAMETIGLAAGREIMFTDQPVAYGSVGRFRFGRSEDVLFGVAHYEASDMAKVAYEAYRDMTRLIREAGFNKLIRTWNYFPEINAERAKLERYRGFCLGRHDALADAGYSLTNDLPAASTIGSRHGDFWVVFLAGNGITRQVENPLQTSAFRYPPDYGPRSPSFSRAIQFSCGREDQLFVSGTASIRGHETVCPDDPAGQCATTVNNLQALLNQAGAGNLRHIGRRAIWKVYVRHRQDVSTIKANLSKELDPSSPIMVVIGDICRQSLLLEIEGVINMIPGKRDRNSKVTQEPITTIAA